MKSKSIYLLTGILITSQAFLGFYGINYDTAKFERRINSIKYQQINKNNEQDLRPQNSKEVVYKYKRKKDFKNVENSVMNMKKQNNYLGSNDKNDMSESTKIALILSGKLLINRN